MSTSSHERDSFARKDGSHPPVEPLRLRVPRLSAETSHPVTLGESTNDPTPTVTPSAEGPTDAAIAPSATGQPTTDNAASGKSETSSDDCIPTLRAAFAPATSAASETSQKKIPPPNEARQERYLRFDPPVESGERKVVPPYLATRRRSQTLIAVLWAGGGGLVTAAIIAIGMSLAGSSDNGTSGDAAETLAPTRWSQNPDAPLRTESSENTAPPVEESSVSLHAPAEPPPVAPQESTAQEAESPLPPEQEPPPVEQPNPEDVAQVYETPAPPVEPLLEDCELPEMACSIHGPSLGSPQGNCIYCGPSFVSTENAQVSPPQDQTARHQPPNEPSVPETYPRTNVANWKFNASALHLRESLRTSMRPGGPAPTGDRSTGPAPSEYRTTSDGGQYRLRGTIDNIPLR